MEQYGSDPLWAMFGYIGLNWRNAQECDMSESQFYEAVNWQVGLDPAYNGYYAAAIGEYNYLLAKFGDPQQALRVLFQENQLPNPKLPAVANHVLLEFMRWQVAFGGFRAFSYMNYNGWMGGGSYLNVPPPYRALT